MFLEVFAKYQHCDIVGYLSSLSLQSQQRILYHDGEMQTLPPSTPSDPVRALNRALHALLATRDGGACHRVWWGCLIPGRAASCPAVMDDDSGRSASPPLEPGYVMADYIHGWCSFFGVVY